MDGMSSVPAFLMKLWKLVNDPETNDVICWSRGGKSFIIKNQVKFSLLHLPMYFKHNNLASFVRQLNMYGFRKYISVNAGGLNIEKDEMEFFHTHFLQGKEKLLQYIKRKIPSSGRLAVPSDNKNISEQIYREVQVVKKGQENMETKMLSLKKENELLWREYANIRQAFSKQQKVVQKLITFLAAFSNIPAKHLGAKRKLNQLALEGADISNASSDYEEFQIPSVSSSRIGGPKIQEITGLDSSPIELSNFSTASNSIKGSKPKYTSERASSADSVLPISLPSDNLDVLPENLVISLGENGPIQGMPAGILSPLRIGEDNVVSADDIMSCVSPNEVMMLSHSNKTQDSTNSNENVDSCASGSENNKKTKTELPLVKNSFQTTNNLEGTTKVDKSKQKQPYKKVVVNMPDGKLMNVKLMSVPSTSKAYPKTNSITYPDQMNKTSGGHLQASENKNPQQMLIKVPDKSPLHRTISENEFQNHIDNFQTSIDSLQDLFSSGVINVDPSVYLNLFDSDGNLECGTNGEILGNEVSLYNPAELVDVDPTDPLMLNADTSNLLIDKDYTLSESSLLANDLNFGNFHPPKKKLNIKREQREPVLEEDAGLQTPQVHIPDDDPFF